MKFNFEYDLKQLLSKEFDYYGITLSPKSDLTSLLFNYFTIRNKLILPIKRNVKYNPEFLKNLHIHPKEKEIRFLQKNIEEGKDINFFQSKRLFQSNFHDHLVNEWNIYHLHLSLSKQTKSKFYKQTNQLLFIYINSEQAIFLDTALHSKGIFADVKWQEILHDHFPEIIEPYRENEILDISLNPNAEDRQMLWNKGYSIGYTKIRDKIYRNPGIGRVGTGHSIQISRQVNSILRWLNTINQQFKNHYTPICSALGINLLQANFSLRFGLYSLEIIEVSTNTLVLNFPNIIDIDTTPT